MCERNRGFPDTSAFRWGFSDHKKRVSDSMTLKLSRGSMRKGLMEAFRDVIDERGTITYEMTQNLWKNFQRKCKERDRGGHFAISFTEFCALLSEVSIKVSPLFRARFPTCCWLIEQILGQLDTSERQPRH